MILNRYKPLTVEFTSEIHISARTGFAPGRWEAPRISQISNFVGKPHVKSTIDGWFGESDVLNVVGGGGVPEVEFDG